VAFFLQKANKNYPGPNSTDSRQ